MNIGGDHKNDLEILQKIEKRQALKTLKFKALKESAKIVDKMGEKENFESNLS